MSCVCNALFAGASLVLHVCHEDFLACGFDGSSVFEATEDVCVCLSSFLDCDRACRFFLIVLLVSRFVCLLSLGVEFCFCTSGLVSSSLLLSSSSVAGMAFVPVDYAVFASFSLSVFAVRFI